MKKSMLTVLVLLISASSFGKTINESNRRNYDENVKRVINFYSDDLDECNQTITNFRNAFTAEGKIVLAGECAILLNDQAIMERRTDDWWNIVGTMTIFH